MAKIFKGGPFLLFSFLSSLLTILIFIIRPDFFALLDLKALDAMMRAREVKTPPKEVVIVAVDEKSVNELGRWPWKRSFIADLIKGLGEARVVGFDIVFSEKADIKNDTILAKAVKDANNVILGYFFRNDSTEAPDSESLELLKRSKINLIQEIGDLPEERNLSLQIFTGVEQNIPEISKGSKGFGSFNIIPSDDGLYRVANLVYGYGEDLYPVLSLAALKTYLGSDIILNTAKYGIDSVDIGDKHIPLDEHGRMQVNYYGGGGTFKTYPVVDVIKGRVEKGTFKDKIVFVGVTEKAVYDIRATPLDPYYPGVEVHATVAGSILENRFLVSNTRTTIINVFLVTALPLLLAFLLSNVHRTYVALLIYGGMSVGLILFLFYLFNSFNLAITPFYPLLSLTLASMSIEAYRNVVIEKKSKFYKKAFSTYVPPDVVSEIIKNPEKLKIGGEKRTITVLFSDIRGFTTMSESMQPEDIVTLLNEYLFPMTKIIFKEEGTLDKYIGDAIMAIFNAPLELPDHAGRGCSAALNMLNGMKELNAAWQQRGYPVINIGIGINTGEAVVGNMGSELRFDYTAIGDTVNLASRLEGLNKIYGTNIIVSEAAYKGARDKFIFRELDLVRVKGKDRPSKIYELMGFFKEAGDKRRLAELFEEGLVDYRNGDFATAKKRFSEILKSSPDDQPTTIYIKRCEEFIAVPPPADWDGVYTAKEK